MAILKSDGQLADQVVQHLAENFRITVVKDWGEPVREAPDVGWRGGQWSLAELDIVQQGIASLAEAMGTLDKFIANLGNISISQVRDEISRAGFQTRDKIHHRCHLD